MTPENAEQLEQLTAYLDGELAPDDRAEIERLLDGDAEARRLLDELRETSALVAGLPRGRAPADLAEQVSARLERQALLGDAPVMATPVRAGWSWANRLALAAAVVLVCTVSWLGWPQFDEPAAMVLTLAEKDANLDTFTAEESTLALGEDRGADVGRHAQPAKAGKKLRTPVGRGRGRSFTAADKPMADREAAAEATSFDYRGEALIRTAVTKDAVAAKAEVPSEAAASIERRLAGNALNVVELQQTKMSKWSNRMVIQARRPSEVVQLASFIREDMARNDIPSLAAAGAADPIAAEASFYSFNTADPSQRMRAIGGQALDLGLAKAAAETPTVVVHVPRSQVEQLIASVQSRAEDNNINASWEFNGRPVSQSAGAGEVVPQLVASDVQPSGASEKMGFAVDDADAEEADFDDVDEDEADDVVGGESGAEAGTAKSPPQPTARAAIRRKAAGTELKREQRDDEEAGMTPDDRKKQADAAQPKGAEKAPDSRPAKAAPEVKAGGRGGRRGSARSRSTAPTEKSPGRTATRGLAAGLRVGSALTPLDSAAADDSGFVTLAISLRCDGALPATSTAPVKAMRRRMTPTTRAVPSATPTTIMGPPAPASRPTTRESTGG